MNIHKNARTTPQSRAMLVHRVLEEHWPVSTAAQAFGISTRTVYKWLARFKSEALRGLWAYATSYPNSAARHAALTPWLRFYNEERPHVGLNRHTPVQRLAQFAEQRP